MPREACGATPDSAGPCDIVSSALIILPRLVAAQSTALDEYVALGLKQNLGLRQAALDADRSQAVVREAFGNFLPSATLNARHTNFSGSGVDFGAFINPVFATLNQLTGTQQFPRDVNVRLPLRQETTVRLAQPVFQAAASAGCRAASAARDAQGATRDATAQALAAQVRGAYLQHAKARRLAELRPLVWAAVRAPGLSGPADAVSFRSAAGQSTADFRTSW